VCAFGSRPDPLLGFDERFETGSTEFNMGQLIRDECAMDGDLHAVVGVSRAGKTHTR
jgi:hypothetical protein